MHMRRKRFEGHVRNGRQRSGERCPTHLRGWLAICPQWCKMRACPARFELKQVENLSNPITSRTERPKVVWKGINLFRSSEFYCTWKHHESEPSPCKAERLHPGIRGRQLALQGAWPLNCDAWSVEFIATTFGVSTSPWQSRSTNH